MATESIYIKVEMKNLIFNMKIHKQSYFKNIFTTYTIFKHFVTPKLPNAKKITKIFSFQAC